MSKLILALVIVGLIGLVVGVNLSDTRENPFKAEVTTTSVSNSLNDLSSEINSLRLQVSELATQLSNEKSQRQSIENNLNEVKQQLALLKPQQATPANETPDSVSDIRETESTSTADNDNTFFQANNFNEPQTTSSILAAIGVDPVIAESIEQLSEKREMEQLYLRNKAIREGWFGTEKYFQENRELEQETNVIRDELGDQKYDEYLYTSGRFNRIKVASVLAESPAEVAAIQAGDILLSYDNERVFNWSDLTSMTASGDQGETVEVSVLRDGAVSSVFIPRGPMGIRLQSTRIDPSNS